MLKHLSFHLTRGLIYALVAAVVLVGAAIIGLRYWLLPNIDNYRPLIEAQLSQRVGNRVAIGQIAAQWDGLRPRLELRNLKIFDAQNQPALQLLAVDATLAWRSLPLGSLHFSSINIVQPTLEVRRDKSGQLFIAGVPVEPTKPGGGLSRWLLDQKDIFISGAVLSWEDEQRDAPPLVLDGVSLHLQNRGSRHRFGLVAMPPPQLAGKIDIRGDLHGTGSSALAEWTGRIYAELPYAEGAAWRRYLPVPSAFKEGVGGRASARLWLDFQDGRIRALTGDLTLSDVAARFDEQLPLLDLASLSGRLRYRVLGQGFEIGAEKLAFTARGNAAVTSTDFTFRSEPGQADKPPDGELRANHLEIAVLAGLLDYFPVDPQLRAQIAQYTPSGTVSDFFFHWTGNFPLPAKYSIKGKVARGAFNAVGNVPGVSGLDGTIAGDEQSGTVAIDSERLLLTLPKVFSAPLYFDTFAAKVAWERQGGETDVRLSKIDFANKDLTGHLSGTYRAAPEGPGIIDLNANLGRVQARVVGQYLPLQLSEQIRTWLVGALLGGNAEQASLRLVGDLRKFPFSEKDTGQFLVRAKVRDATLEYAPTWPQIKNIECDLLFEGRRMQITAQKASVFGAMLTDVSAVIPNLGNREPILEVNGNASGPFAEKLRFISASPVGETLGTVLDGLTGQGSGKLALKLSIPLKHPHDTKIAGDYDFIDVALDLGRESLGVNGINGRLQFSEKEVHAQGITAQILEGPVAIDVTSRAEGGVVINGRGRVAMSALKPYIPESVLRNLQGSTEWQGELRFGKPRSQLKLSAPLAGVSSTLPVPFAKAEGEVWPLTLTRQSEQGGVELISISLTDSIHTQLELVPGTDGKSKLKRGYVNFGSVKGLPARDGLSIGGRLPSLDLDRWQELLGAEGGEGRVPIAGIELEVGALTAQQRDFGALQVTAQAQKDGWSGSLAGPAARGDFTWQSAGRGSLYARFKQLNIPEKPAKEQGQAVKEASNVHVQSPYPAVDVVAENLQLGAKKFGRFELKAVPDGGDWRIEHLHLAQPEATLDADGVWYGDAREQTRLKLKLESGNVGNLLAAMGYPDSVKAGKAELAGDVRWPGSPADMELAKLSGELTLIARNGQFLKIQSGAGKLLGLISLQSLPRRMTLDFHDIFSEGFSFDSITGTMNIHDGLLKTNDFVISGSSARVEMSGDVNLANETQQLQVKVIPGLSEGVSLATGILGGPVAGVGILLAQKMLNNPIGRAAGFEYSIAGTWDNPTMVKGGATPSPNTLPAPNLQP